MSSTDAAPPTHAAAETMGAKLEPVREALVRDARADADRIISTATNAAKAAIAAATAQANAEVERARHRAERSAQANAEQVLARVRNDGHRVVLATQRQLLEQLIGDVHDLARRLRTDPGYPALLDRLEAMARDQLGDQAVIERDPQPGGGLIATAGSRRVDYRLAALADRALDTLADDVAELWN